MDATRIVALGLLALVPAACRGDVAQLGGATRVEAGTISFADMQAINPGARGEWVLREHPVARTVRRRPDGTLEALGYEVTDPHGDVRPLMLHMDANGFVERKQYGGPMLLPPAAEGS